MLNKAGAAEPFSVTELGAALDKLARFETRPLVAVAVSGGADSLALAILADRWARARGGEIRALSVDHGLRAESAEELRRLRGWLAARSIRHEVLVWTGPKPRSGIQAAARHARYRLLADWCRDHGCLHLLTAHHRDDQIETHLIRWRANSGIDGLAGMSAVREIEHCRILRPLLGIGHDRLVAFLVAEDQPFITDPSNRDPAYERARLRLKSGTAVTATAVAALGHQRALREHAADRLLARSAALHPAGFGMLDLGLFRATPSAAALRALAAMTTTIGGAAYPPRRERMARLHDALCGGQPAPRTLGGCRFVPWRGRLLVLRELAAAEGRVALAPGENRSWDRRFLIISDDKAPETVEIDYLGFEGARALGCKAERPGGLPRLLYPILPAVWDADGLAAVSHLGYRRIGAGAPPQIVLRPVNSLTGAGFAVV
ncbi:MAG TPA: tRNA lysidine(34) synthetase TilS [Stellaceae bacterium]